MRDNFLKQVERSQTLLLNERSEELERQGKTLYRFGFGQSPFAPPQRVVNRLKETAQFKDYAPVQGIAALREAAAHFHRRLDHLDVEAGDVLIGPGSKMIIYSVLAAFQRADVIVPLPAWVSYIPQARLCGHHVITIETKLEARWRVTPDLLQRAFRAKTDAAIPTILILNYPGNPDGLTYSSQALTELASVARAANALIVSDEIYGLLHHSGGHESMARYYQDTIVTSGLSKWCGAGGWRLGVGLLPKSLGSAFKDTLLGIASETYSCVALPMQMAACEAYYSPDAASTYVGQQRRILAALGNACYQKLLRAGLGVCAPEGGFYLFLDFPHALARGAKTSAELCETLLADTGVVLLPGSAFGMPPSSLSARLAYVDFDGSKALAAAERLGPGERIGSEFLGQHCTRTVSGVAAICRWACAAASTGSIVDE